MVPRLVEVGYIDILHTKWNIFNLERFKYTLLRNTLRSRLFIHLFIAAVKGYLLYFSK